MHKGMCGRKENPPGSAKQDKTLADYLERKGFFKQVPENQDKLFPKKKLTFEEWYKTAPYYSDSTTAAREAWEAAQENV